MAQQPTPPRQSATGNAQESFLLRWRGRQEGPYTLRVMEGKLAAGEIGLLHEVLVRGRWKTVRDYLAEEAAARQAEDLARREAERLAREAERASSLTGKKSLQDLHEAPSVGSTNNWASRLSPKWVYACVTVAALAFGIGIYSLIERRGEAHRAAVEPDQRSSAGARTTLARDGGADSLPRGSGTGFFITEEGFLVTSEHVVQNASRIRLLTKAALVPAKVVKVDRANDLALLKAEGRFASLPLTSSGAMRLGSSVATVGFPNIVLQGFSPKLAKGEIASLSGGQDDPKYFQISAPVQPGNSGGALVDDHGNVVGVVAAKLDLAAALITSGALPENVNYAVKSSFLLSFLESVPEVAAMLKRPNTKERRFEEVVKDAEQAAALVLVY